MTDSVWVNMLMQCGPPGIMLVALYYMFWEPQKWEQDRMGNPGWLPPPTSNKPGTITTYWVRSPLSHVIGHLGKVEIINRWMTRECREAVEIAWEDKYGCRCTDMVYLDMLDRERQVVAPPKPMFELKDLRPTNYDPLPTQPIGGPFVRGGIIYNNPVDGPAPPPKTVVIPGSARISFNNKELGNVSNITLTHIPAAMTRAELELMFAKDKYRQTQ